MNGIFLEEGRTSMHEEGIRECPKQEKKMPVGWRTEMEEEIKSKETNSFGGGVEIAALFKTGNSCQTRLNPRPKKKTLKHL